MMSNLESNEDMQKVFGDILGDMSFFNLKR